MRMRAALDSSTLLSAALWPFKSRNEGRSPCSVTTAEGRSWPSASHITPSPSFSAADPPSVRFPGIAVALPGLFNFNTPRVSVVAPW